MADSEFGPPGNRTVMDDGRIVVSLPFSEPETDEGRLTRVDLIFTGVAHTDVTFEVRIFLNNIDVSDRSERTPENNYGGKFVVFGHGGCFGDTDHCAVPEAGLENALAVDTQRGHPLAPQKKIITITEPLRHIFEAGNGLETVTLVPIKRMPRNEDCGQAPGVFTFSSVRLEAYR